MELRIKKIELCDNKRGRKIKVKVQEGRIVHNVTIEPLYESFQQYGSREEVLWKTMPIAEKYNDWLHGID